MIKLGCEQDPGRGTSALEIKRIPSQGVWKKQARRIFPNEKWADKIKIKIKIKIKL